MQLSILGALLGTGLFVGGFVYHDVQFYEFRKADAVRVSPNGYVMFESSNQEENAYAIGMAGAAVLTLSLKHIWDSRKNKSSHQAYSKFRKTLDLLLGTGFLIGGIGAHDKHWDRDSPRWSSRNADDPDSEWRMYQKAGNVEEHFGFALGALGAVWLTASVKHAWDLRGREQVDLNETFRDFQLQLHDRELFLRK